MAKTIWRFRNIEQNYPPFQLNIPELMGKKGETIGLMGPNGAGKTTLIKILLGLSKPDKGNVFLFNDTIENIHPNQKEMISYVGEKPGFFYSLSVKKNIEIISSFYHKWDKELETDLSRDSGFSLDGKVESLSRGGKVILSLIIALCHQPSLIVLDEPTANLDIMNRKKLIEILDRVKRDHQTHIFFSSHQAEDMEELADKIFFIQNGQISLKLRNRPFISVPAKNHPMSNEPLWSHDGHSYFYEDHSPSHMENINKISLRAFAYEYFSAS